MKIASEKAMVKMKSRAEKSNISNVPIYTWKDFLSTTNIIGLTNIGTARTGLRQLIWFIVFCFFAAQTFHGLRSFYNNIYNYSISLTMFNREAQYFPAVTICNLNRIQCSKLLDLQTKCNENPESCQDFGYEGLGELISKACQEQRDVQSNQDENKSSTQQAGRQNQSNNTQASGETETSTKQSSQQGQGSANSGQNETTSQQAGQQNQDNTTQHSVENETTTQKTDQLNQSNTKQQDSVETETTAQQSDQLNQSSTNQQDSVKIETATAKQDDTGEVTAAGIEEQTRRSGSRRKRSPPPGDCVECSVPETTTQEDLFLQYYMNMSDSRREEIGQDFDNFIRACTFKGKDCLNSSFFAISQTPTYGNCFTFNLIENTKDIMSGKRVVSQTGPNFGLSLILNLEQSQYMKSGYTESAGARIVVHSAEAIELPDSFGMDLSPASSAQISIHQVNTTRLEKPYESECMSEWKETAYTSFNSTMDWPYSVERCKRYCLQLDIMETCHCFHPLYIEKDSDRRDLIPCNITSGAEDYTCIDIIMDEFDSFQKNCSCNGACDQTEYESRLSTSFWPANQYQIGAVKSYLPVSDGIGEQGPTAAQLTMASQNLLKVSVYFSSLNTKLVAETKTYTIEEGTLMSSLGGVFSLYLGISFCGLFELLELIIDFILNSMNACSGRPIGRKHLP